MPGILCRAGADSVKLLDVANRKAVLRLWLIKSSVTLTSICAGLDNTKKLSTFSTAHVFKKRFD